MDLVPPHILVARFLGDGQAVVDELDLAFEEATRQLEDYLAEHAIEDGLAWDAVDEKGKVTQKSANAAHKESKAQGDDEAVEALTKT
jgi:type I restriction enzyme M protein